MKIEICCVMVTIGKMNEFDDKNTKKAQLHFTMLPSSPIRTQYDHT